MKEFHDYLVPDYYNAFSCKMGACRAACCVGWPISFSLEDYFHLTGSECSADLRDRIDRGVRVELQPTPECYARIAPRYDGECPMRLPDGRCAVHAELGEDALSFVCRLYPRGARRENGCYECSCANSCEGVLELLFSRDEPIHFEKQTLTLDLPKETARLVHFETIGREQEIRLWLIGIMQNRALPLPQRLISLGMALKQLEEILHNKDADALSAMLGKPWKQTLPSFEVNKEHLLFGLEKADALVSLLDDHSQSLHDYGQDALAYFHGTDYPFERYVVARLRFESRMPKWEIWFEHMLVNHMFFEQFPFQDRPESLWNEFVAICAIYTLLRFLAIGWMAHRQQETDFVDMAAAAFRLIDHTDFDRYASQTLRSLGCTTPQTVFDLIVL